ncbi:hypothetical protein [Mycolicibacterium sp. XJ879]
MPDDAAAPPDPDDQDGPVFTSYGIASTVIGVIAVVAVALAALIWTQHREDVEELQYRTRAMAAAADWTATLINMDSGTVEASMTKLHEGTVGQLHADFDAAIKPFRELVQTLQSNTRGQVDSVAVESIHRPGAGATTAPPPPPQPELTEFAARTDTVMVVATSVSENAGDDEPRTVRWTLRLDVSDVDGDLLISRLEPIR